MDHSAEALAILKRARDILLDRLAERVVESKEPIIEDALGLAFTSEIDEVHEQLGTRLSHLNNLISQMQLAEKDRPALVEDDESISVPIDGSDRAASPFVQADTTTSTSSEATLLLSAPMETTDRDGADAGEAITFADFAKQVRVADLDGAGRSLAELFSVDFKLGRRCAQVFADRFKQSPLVVQKAMSLREEIQSGSMNSALLLLHECFGLQGVDSLRAVESLRARLTK